MSEKIVQFNEEIIKGQLKELVRGSVEETLNELLEKEAESLTQAARYERSEARHGYRSGHYDRNLTTTSGNVTLHMPRLKGMSFETAIIERYRRRESSVEEALIEMYLAGVSVRRVEDITEALWGSKVSPATISELNKKAYASRCVEQGVDIKSLSEMLGHADVRTTLQVYVHSSLEHKMRVVQSICFLSLAPAADFAPSTFPSHGPETALRQRVFPNLSQIV